MIRKREYRVTAPLRTYRQCISWDRRGQLVIVAASAAAVVATAVARDGTIARDVQIAPDRAPQIGLLRSRQVALLRSRSSDCAPQIAPDRAPQIPSPRIVGRMRLRACQGCEASSVE